MAIRRRKPTSPGRRFQTSHDFSEITTTSPEDIDLSYDYASVLRPSWLSSDSGSLWIDGSSVYDAGQWKHLRPVNLKAGDVVTFTVMGV